MVWGEVARAGDGDPEDFVRDAESHQKSVEERRVRVEALAERTAHQQVSGVDDKGDERHFGVGGQVDYGGVKRVFARRRMVEETCDVSFQR